MKHQWRKNEKETYLPKCKPQIIDIPPMQYFTIEGTGDPNTDLFPEHIGVLYSLSYAVKMSPKKDMAPDGYFDYTVYPLEGLWDINAEARDRADGQFTKDELVFKLMIRQPEFVSEVFAREVVAYTQQKKPHELLHHVQFEKIDEGKCVGMLHQDSYDSEPESFRKMEAFCTEQGLKRISGKHKEIYLNDARKTPPEKLKTVLRFQVANR